MPEKLPIFIIFALSSAFCAGADIDSLERELRELRNQNASLKAQVERQQVMIDELARRQDELRSASKPVHEPAPVAQSAVRAAPANEPRPAATALTGPAQKLGKVHLSGEGAVAYFGGQRNAN
jgi:hypothetical protein